MNKPIWTPSDPDQTGMIKFTKYAENLTGKSFPTYQDLHAWSVTNLEEFWKGIWDFTNVIGDMPQGAGVTDIHDFIGSRFFDTARLNYAENLLHARDPETPAMIFWREDGVRHELSNRTLMAQVSQVRQALMEIGFEPGDRAAAVVANTPETLVAMLAVTSLGGVWSSCSPDFGVPGILDRFTQIEPKILFYADRYIYRTEFDLMDRLDTIRENLPTVQKIIILPFNEDTHYSGLTTLTDILDTYPPSLIEFERFPFNHPLFIMFSSGTTGVPKCIVHGTGGVLLQHKKEHQLHADIGPLDRVFYFSTCGWMMWNWQVSALASGATLLTYEGSPVHPKKDILFDFAEEEGMTFFGTSAKYIDAISKFNLEPRLTHDLSKLRVMGSTGSPLGKEGFTYVYKHVKEDLLLASISGGTDILSCFVLSNPSLPLMAGEIQVPGLGMDVQVFNDQGKSVTGEKGELVCCTPFPSKPLGFWNDPNNERFIKSYFSGFEGIWTHGDYIEQTENGGYIIHGRSDAVLNPGGVRIGTAEIYRQVEKVDQVLESLAVGQDWNNDVRVILFVKLKEGEVLTPDLNSEIKNMIRTHTTPRHVPAKIVQVTDLPKTRSGKLVELAVRDLIHGRSIANINAIQNPECLKEFELIAQNELR